MSGHESADKPPIAIGALVAERYRVTKVLGRGGMGIVYEAEHVKLGRAIALKVLLPMWAADAGVIARFLQEARAAASIGHPGIVEVFDLGEAEHGPFLAMELLRGEELHARIERAHPLPIDEVLQVGAEMAEALAAAHARGIVHRDLKPQNIFLAEHGKKTIVKVLDFGIAKLLEAERGDVPLTRTNQVMGTPMYMAPEQLRNAPVDGRTDVYAIGGILYEALTGRPPFSATTFPELVLKVTQDEPTPITALRADVPEALAAVVERAMRKKLEDRFESAADLGVALEQLMSGWTPRAPASIELAQTHPSNPDLVNVPSGLLGETPFGIESSAQSSAESSAESSDGRRPRARVWLFLLAAAAVPVAAGLWLVGAFDARPFDAPPFEAAPEDREPEATQGASAIGASAIGASAIGASAIGEPTAPAQPDPMPARHEEAPREAAPSRSVQFTTEPSGALVSSDDDPICRTPCTADLPDELHMLTITRRGYQTEHREVAPPLPPEVRLTLRRRRASSSVIGTPESGDPAPLPALMGR